MPTAAHFLYIPGVLLLGIVIGWILGSRAAADAYAAALRKQERSRRSDEATGANRGGFSPRVVYLPTANRWARTSGKPAAMILACAVATS
jgi:hypothetical protein